MNKENCQYCHLHIEFLPDPDRTIFKWHLDGHGEKESLPQTTKEQVIENFDKRFVSGMFRTEKQQEMIDFLSSTYDTAYEKGVRDAMERVEELPKKVKLEEYTYETIRLALSELLKK